MDAGQLQRVLQGLLTAQDQRDEAQRRREDVLRAEQRTQLQLEILVKQTPLCDGMINDLVREWIRDIDHAENCIGAQHINDIVSQTVAGPLRREVEHFITVTAETRGIARNAVPWADLRNHVCAQFLSLDENAFLRDYVERKVVQQPDEPVNHFSRRFREAADYAYPRAQRNVDQQRVLVKAFVQGIHDDRLARRLIEEHHPLDIDTAITGINQICTRIEAYERMCGNSPKNLRMEVDPVVNDANGVILPILTTLVEAVNMLQKSISLPAPVLSCPEDSKSVQVQQQAGCGNYGHKWKGVQAAEDVTTATKSEMIGAVGDYGRPMVQIPLAGCNLQALVDTGAAVSLLRLDYYEQYCSQNHRPTYLRPATRLVSVTGNALEVKGMTEIKIDGLPVPLAVTIVRNLPHPMILGTPQLQKGAAIIDLNHHTLLWHNQQWPLVHSVAMTNDDAATIALIIGLGPELPVTGHQRYDNFLKRHVTVFSAEGEVNGDYNVTKLEIQTSRPPISQKAYRTPLHKQRLIEDCLDEMLCDGVIQPSSSPWASPVTLVPKRDGSTRFCVDYRRLNEVTIKDTYPLPVISDIFDQVAGSVVYSTLDLKAGYHQIRVAEDDIPKTAFRCHRGLLEFQKMPFGVANGPSVF